ncbi:hypothetical protein PoB_003961700 [Plakobranchus ocellatus]|uniref:Uncharacterized protein n=1 Tax=Plakobranchus ocellatus TaxID=259542 RepID=A0AAV4B1Y7_9GAST|nr:hypothetical protein PoB_003961700 [Plakobranchus ocellatus]
MPSPGCGSVIGSMPQNVPWDFRLVDSRVISGFQAVCQARATVVRLEPATEGSLQISDNRASLLTAVPSPPPPLEMSNAL